MEKKTAVKINSLFLQTQTFYYNDNFTSKVKTFFEKMTHLLSYTLALLKNNGILVCLGLDVPQNVERIARKVKIKNKRYVGYIHPVYNKDCLEELDEDGSALIEFIASNEGVWEKSVDVFETCGYPVFMSRSDRSKFGVILSESNVMSL